jgi:HEAT repeat protein
MTKKQGKPATLEKALAQIGLALRDPRSPESRKQLSDALLNGSSIIAARVATSIAEGRLEGFEEVLQQAFQRFLDDPVATDAGCRAKVAALGALDQLESTNAALFLAATSYVQIEGGGRRPADTAVGVRARAVVALARIGFSDLPLVAAHMLADPESPVRQAAADALAHHGERAGAGAVWLKLEMGDEDELVVLACASALLSLAPNGDFARCGRCSSKAIPPCKSSAR